MVDRIQSPQAISMGLSRQGDLRRGPRGDSPQGSRGGMRPTGDDGGPNAAGKGRAQDPYRNPPSPRTVAHSVTSLAQRLVHPVGGAPGGSLGYGVAGEGLQISDGSLL